MPDLDPSRLEIAQELRLQIADQDTLTANQARTFVRGLQTEWEVPPIQWGARESNNQLDDAKRLFHAAGIYQQVEGPTSANAIHCFRRAGELLEWLTRAGDNLDTFVSLELLAAAAYQLGGLPAMASALLGKVRVDSLGEQLYANFLCGDFDEVLMIVSQFWKDNLDIADRESPTRLLNEDGEDKTSWYFTVELIRVLGGIADALRRGDSHRINRIMKKFEALDKLALRIFSDEASMLVMLLYQVATAYCESSIYEPVRQIAELKPERAGRLERFARTQFNRKRGILWTSQRHGISRLIEQSSFALCTPTGSGKTLVANLALVKELLLCEDDGLAPLALYLVPSRALAGEVEAKLTSELGQDLIITGLYGGADWGITDYWLDADQPTVLIATVEKADALMRYLSPFLLSRLRLLIVDEAHQVVPEDNERTQVDFAEHSSRSIRLEGFVSRLLLHVPDISRIALTAVAGGAALPVSRWIEGRQNAEAIGTDYRSTRQIIGILETSSASSGRMTFEILNGHQLTVRDRNEVVFIPLRTPSMPVLPAVMRNSINRFNELTVLWTALHLINTGRRILISVMQQPERTMGWYKDAINLDNWHEAISFTPPEDEKLRARFDETRAACIDYCGDESFELALLDCGIATNYGQMPQRLRRLMTDLIERGVCQITVATATLTEGVNLPFDIIFLTALKRRSFDPVINQPVVTPISTSEFRNLAGRAGRPGSSNSMEGLTLVAIPQRPSTTAHSQMQTQQNQIQVMKNDFVELKRLLLEDERIQNNTNSPLTLLLSSIAESAFRLFNVEGNAFLEWLEAAIPQDISEDAGQALDSDGGRLADTIDELDGVLLSVLEEAERLKSGDLDGVNAEEVLTQLWIQTFSAYAAVQENWLEQAFVRRGRAFLEQIYPDANERSRLYQYGFTPYVGQRFQAIAPTMKAIIEDTTEYGTATAEQRVAVFENLGELLINDRGYGFRIRNTETDRVLLATWHDVLRWWMLVPDARRPEPEQLRSWQRFVSENIDFRLGVTVGAVVAGAWSDGADDPLAIPSLDEWQETTQLPWFGFWIRELLRWGTLDPFVAFALAQGLARSRDEASAMRHNFEAWLNEKYQEIETEDYINPQFFLKWQKTLPRHELQDAQADISIEAELTGTTGQNKKYNVIPVRHDDYVSWIDASGYELARSQLQDDQIDIDIFRKDFELQIDNGSVIVKQTYTA